MCTCTKYRLHGYNGLLLWNNHVELPGGIILIVGPIGMVTSNIKSNLQAVLRLHRQILAIHVMGTKVAHNNYTRSLGTRLHNYAQRGRPRNRG